MSDKPEREKKSRPYEYSWALPAPGTPWNGVAPEGSPGHETDPGHPATETGGSERVETPEAGSRIPGHPSSSPGIGHPSTFELKLLGLVGWSATVCVGISYLVSRGGPFPGLQVGEIGGVWVVLSAVLWFLPGRLARRTPQAQPTAARYAPVRENADPPSIVRRQDQPTVRAPLQEEQPHAVETKDTSQSSIRFDAFLRELDSLRRSTTINQEEDESRQRY